MFDSLPGDSSLPPGCTDQMIDEATRGNGDECQRCGGALDEDGVCSDCGEDQLLDLGADDFSDPYDDFMDRL